MRIAAPGEVDLAAETDLRTKAVTLIVDLGVDWLALECEGLARRIIIKPAHGKFVIRGLPPGTCYARPEDWAPCHGELGPGQVRFLELSTSQVFGRTWGRNLVCEFFEESNRPWWRRAAPDYRLTEARRAPQHDDAD